MSITCERFRPHVMLMDLHLCGDDYGATCNLLTGGDELEATRVVGMSGRLSDGQIARLSSEGFEGALRKPFTVRQVIDAIEQAVAVVY